MPIDIPRQASTLPSISRGSTKLPGYLSIYRCAQLYAFPIHSFVWTKIAKVSAWNTVACAKTEKDNLFYGLTPHTLVPALPAILDPSIYQISPID
jgi:hypothetical protein